MKQFGYLNSIFIVSAFIRKKFKPQIFRCLFLSRYWNDKCGPDEIENS